MKVLIAPDKFKGTLSAAEAAKAMAEGVAAHNPAWQVQLMPIADGGEGTAELLTLACGGEMVKARASDPLLRQSACQFGIGPDGATAYIDLAAASGLQALQPGEANPMRTSTIGTGELVVQAINKRCRRIVLGLGGSATLDCGMGIAHALGVVFQGEDEVRLAPIGRHLGRVEYIQVRNLRPELARTELLLLADVDCGLLGEDGAMQFAAQKGLLAEDMPALQKGLEHFANLMEARHGLSLKHPGMGAAGGAAVCGVALLGGRLVSGADFVLEALGLPRAVSEADLVLTGEGRLDAQTLRGKAVGTLARMAQSQGKHIAAVCGQVDIEQQLLQGLGLDAVRATFAPGTGWEEIQAKARAELVAATTQLLVELAPRLGG